jgi:hypothetical protein
MTLALRFDELVRTGQVAITKSLGQFLGLPSGAFGQDTLGQRLQPPGQAFEHPGAVPGGRLASEDLGVADTQFAGGHPLEGGEVRVQGLFHVVLLTG